MDPAARVALIGYGLAGAVFHAPLVSATPGLRLATIVTSDPQRAAQARAEHPRVEVIADADVLWRGEAHDLVVVATPNRWHAPLAHAALAAGSAVVVDKPLATSAAEAQALVDAARRAGRLLTVFQNRRWDADWLTLRALHARGALGTLRRFESRFERWRPQPRAGWRRSAADGDAGGVLFDLGSHLADQALQLCGAVDSVYAELRSGDAQDADDDAFVALRHHDGTQSHLWMSSVAADAGPRLRVLGTGAAYVKHALDPQEDALRGGRRPRDGGAWGVEAPSAWGELVAGDSRERVETLPGDWPAFYAAVERSLRLGAPPPVDAADAVAVLHVIEAARRSSATRQVVSPAG